MKNGEKIGAVDRPILDIVCEEVYYKTLLRIDLIKSFAKKHTIAGLELFEAMHRTDRFDFLAAILNDKPQLLIFTKERRTIHRT